MNGWLVTAHIPATERRSMTLLYVANVADKDGAAEAVKRTMRARADERLEVVRPATDRELAGMRLGAVRNRASHQISFAETFGNVQPV